MAGIVCETAGQGRARRGRAIGRSGAAGRYGRDAHAESGVAALEGEDCASPRCLVGPSNTLPNAGWTLSEVAKTMKKKSRLAVR